MRFTPIKLMQQGFTLIELVIVIVMLSALGIMTSSYIGTGVDIYMDISERDKSLGIVRFAMERLRREVGNALPNSAVVDGDCLTFTPISGSFFYSISDFPTPDNSASEKGTIAAISTYTFTTGDKAVVNFSSSDDLETTDKVHEIKSISSDGLMTFKDSVAISFPDKSPTQHVYIINENVSYYFNGTDLYRGSQCGTGGVLMAEDIEYGSFSASDGTELSELFVRVSYMLNFNGQKVKFKQTLQINNVP